MSSTVSEARIKRAFATFDYNNKGHISHDELERILRALGFRGMSKQLVATFMRTTSTRKNPSEVTYNDCLRIIQSSGFDHIFEESFQVCQVLDKAESGRIVPEAMAKAAKADGRFDAYIKDGAADSPSAAMGNTIGSLRRSSLTTSSNTRPSPLRTNAVAASGSAPDSRSNTPAGNANRDSLDEDELVGGGDRRRVSVTNQSHSLGIPIVNTDSIITSERTPLAPASAKRQRLFNQIHRFVHRSNDSDTFMSSGGLGLVNSLTPSSPNTAASLNASGKHQTQPFPDVEQDAALTFDEWRHVQTTAEKVNDTENRRRRRHMPQASQSLSNTLRGASSSGVNTPRGGGGSGTITMSMSSRF